MFVPSVVCVFYYYYFIIINFITFFLAFNCVFVNTFHKIKQNIWLKLLYFDS